MIKKKRVIEVEELPEFAASIAAMPEDNKIFVDKSLEIAEYIFRLMEQKGMKQKDLADKMGKTEAEVSKWLAGMHNYTLRSLSKIEAALGSTVICTPHKQIFHKPDAINCLKVSIQSQDYSRGITNKPIVYTKVVSMNTQPNGATKAI